MRELVEFRILEEHAPKDLAPNEGKPLGSGSIRKIVLPTTDPRVARICEIQRELRARGDCLFRFSMITRRYSVRELGAAELLLFYPWPTFEPSGEECGTQYDDSAVCPLCGAGRRQTSDLVLDLFHVPKNMDFARTIARREWIVSASFARLVREAGLTGFALRPVQHKGVAFGPVTLETVPTGRVLLAASEAAGIPRDSAAFFCWLDAPEQAALWERARQEHAARVEARRRKAGRQPPVWYQLEVTSPPVVVAPPTRFGINICEDDAEGRYRCPLGYPGHVRGPTILSEISVLRSTWDGSDFVATQHLAGQRAGVIMPEPRILMSQRAWRLIRDNGLKGLYVEVAHFV